MYKNKVFCRVWLVLLCITLVVSCIGIGVLAASSNAVLQVKSANSSAVLKDGKIQVCLAEGDTFTYNEVLDLSTATKNVQLLNMQFDPTEVGIPNATRVKLRFTDLHDEDNYFTISLNSFAEEWASGHIYVTAGAADQPQIGIENAGDPANMKPHVNDVFGYGAAVDYSMAGLPKNPEDSNLTLYFDYAEKAIYADRETYTHSKQLVVDLDDPELFGTDLWTGFTTGQVKLSVFASNYQSATCDFTIAAINGSSSFRDVDQSAPQLFVNIGYEPNAIPMALVGKPYPVFPATAIDGCDGEVETTASVYYQNSGTSEQVAVENGKFTPARSGKYVIEYTAKDHSGNTATASVTVEAVFSDGLKVTLQDVITQTDIGLPVQVLSGVSCTGASGKVSYQITAKNVTTGDQVEIDDQTHSFIPMTEGQWEVTVTVQDHISTVVETFTVTANRTAQPQVYDTVPMQDYFIVGAAYQLPVLYGYDFSSGTGVLTAMDVYVTENGSSETAVANGKYTPANEGAVTVTYRLTVDGKVCEKSYTATVVKTKTILNTVSLSKYFVDPTGAATASSASAKITYSFKKDTKLDFVNFVQVKQLSFGFQVGSQQAYSKISVYLTDILSGKQVKLSYNKTADGVAFSVNDGGAITLSSGFDSTFTLAFSADTGIVVPETGKEFKVKTFLDGSEFTGFTDSLARFAVELSGVTGSSQFVVQNLNGQKLNYATKDSVAPQFIANALSGSIKKGEKLELKGAFVYDVLDPIATVTLKVTDPDGTAVTDDNGIVLNGTQDASKDTVITMEKLGTYTVLYTTKDGKNNTGRHIYTITATDGEGPTITLLEHTEAVQIGDTVTVAGTQVQDNITTNCTVASYVFDPEGVKMPVTNGQFEATQAGVYTIRYMAVDGDGNYAFASYEVTAQSEEARYISQSMSLGSDLTLNLWGNAPESYVSSISGTMAYSDVTDDFKLSELTRTEDGLYRMQAEMAVAQMTERVNLTLKHNIVGDVIRRSYSIRDYLVALIEGDYDQETKDLSLELLNMGAWAQKYFHYNASNLANQGYEITPANAMDTECPTVDVNGQVSGVIFHGVSVRFLSQTAVRFYFWVDGAVDGYTFTVDGTEYEAVAKDGMYYIETPGIDPQNMNDVITVSVTDGTDTLSVGYAPIWYFIRTYHNSDNETTKSLMAAAYSYYKEAQAYEQKTTSGQIKQPETPTGEGVYICMDLLITTLSESTEPVEIRFYAHDYVGNIHEGCTDRITVNAGKKTKVKLNAEKYMVDGVIPEGLGIAVFGGPTWDAKLSDGNTPDRHTLTISNVWLKGEYEQLLDLRTATVNSGTEGTGYIEANGSGEASIVDGKIVITNGFRYDGHKIALNNQNAKNRTYICMDLQIDTLGGNWTDDIEVRFYPYDYKGTVHNYYKDKIVIKAGTPETVKLNLNRYLVDGAFTGIGVAIFGGPTWDAKLPDGTTPDRHTLTISGMRLEGGQEKQIDLTDAVVYRGNEGTGYTDANGSGEASVADDKIVIANGFCYDAHKISLTPKTEPEETEPSEPETTEPETTEPETTEPETTEPETTEPETTEPETTEPETTEPETTEPEATDPYVVLDMQIDTLGGNWTKDIEIRFYAYDFAGNPHEAYADKVLFQAGQKQTVKLDAQKYLTDGKLNGIGIGIFGGPEWNTQISDGVYDRHTVTISGVRLEGQQTTVYDLSKSTMTSGTVNTGYTVANGNGKAVFGETIVISDGFCYDCHKISLTPETESGEEDSNTYIVMDMLLTTLSNSTGSVEIRFCNNAQQDSVHTAYTDLVQITAGTKTTVKLDAQKYLVDGELPGFSIAIFGGPEWNTQLSDGTYDRHSVVISDLRLEGVGAKDIDLSTAAVTTGIPGSNTGGSIAIADNKIVISGGFCYDGHKITF
ncbi:MAG: hypothetical protein IJO28_01950 [Oscillospiraceae bacterium]|nr:hypothetical protein [Oscillospiraceae bacterium]